MPLVNAEMEPITTPMNIEIMTTMKLIPKVSDAPLIIRESISLPKLSVPSKKLILPSSLHAGGNNKLSKWLSMGE